MKKHKFLQSKKPLKPILKLNKVADDALPPHDLEVERMALGCVVLAGETKTQAEADEMLLRLRPNFFYGLVEKEIHAALVKLRMENHAIDTVMLVQRLKADKNSDLAQELAIELADKPATIWNFSDYIDTLKNFALRRWTLAKQARLGELAHATELSPEQLRTEFAEIFDQSERIGSTTRPRLKVWRVNEILKHKIPVHLRLVGDNEVSMGYDGVVVLAGPGSSGKSLCTATLALAGAIGSGLWMGRKVHRKFKTLIIQAENGVTRLKSEIEALAKNHPGVDIHGHIFFSEPPEGGLPFHNSEFRSAVRRAIVELKPDLIIIDPWSQVATEDAAKEVVDKLAEIRSCFPAGEECPGVVIVAHTKKPRAGEIHRGRSLASFVSGSVALPNTARCVYVLLPWSDDVEDDRIYWCCPKLNNGEMYPPSVWRRRFGTFFEHDGNTDPREWGKEQENDGARAVTEKDLRDCFNGATLLRKSELVKRLREMTDASDATCYRAITPGERGYLAHLVEDAGEGMLRVMN